MKKTTVLGSVTLAAMLAATLSTAVLAERGGMGPMGGMPMLDFDRLDADKDGKLTEAELKAAMTARLTEADADKDGKLSAEELMAMRDKMQAERKLARAKAMIERHDSDGDGFVSITEMEAAAPNMGKMVSRLDDDGDGAISKDEMAAMQDHMGGHGGKKGHHGGGMWGNDD